VILAAAVALIVVGSVFAVTFNVSPKPPGSIRIVQVWFDGVDAPQGMGFYILDVNASDTQSSVWQFNPADIEVSISSSRTSSPVDNYSEVPLLGSSDISPGKSVAGDDVYLLPQGETPTELSYHGTGTMAPLQVQVPAVSGVASRFDPSVHVQFNGTSADRAVATWDGITNQTNGLTFFGEEPGYRNYTFVFFTGQKIYVTFALYYYKFPYDPDSIVVDSVTSDDGYAVSSVVGWQASLGVVQAHQLPVTMTGYGSNVEVTALVTVPPGPQPGVLHFTLQFST